MIDDAVNRLLLDVAVGLLLILLASIPAQAQSFPSDLPTTNQSAKITTGNTFQLLLAPTTYAVDQQRKSLTIENNNASDNCNVIVGTLGGQVIAGTTTTATNVTVGGVVMTAAQASILLLPAGSYQRYFPYVPSDAVVGTCSSTGDSIYLDIQQ